MKPERLIHFDRGGAIMRFPDDHPYVQNFSIEELHEMFPATRIEVYKAKAAGSEGLEDVL